MTDFEKAKILYGCQIWMAGNGHFNLSVDDAAEVLRIIRTKRTSETLKKALAEFYENHPEKRAIDESFREHYEEY